MPAIAFSNNDIAVIAWTFERHLNGCLGFAVIRIDSHGNETVLPGMASFPGQPSDPKRTTAQAPVQKFWWKDLYAERGGTYSYRVVPMAGAPGALEPLAGVEPLVSNAVTITEKRPPFFNAYFNRGIVATQALSHALKGKPSRAALEPHIVNPNDQIRKDLQGQLYEGVTALLDRADSEGGTINAALYQLNDPNGLEKRLQAADHGDPRSRTVILGNEQQAASRTSPASEDADAKNRQHLEDAGVTVIDRILRKGSIPHNKFMVLNQKGAPATVLTGSTNWTSTGLCTQTNNALVVESAKVAQLYIDYWNTLKADVEAADGDQKKLQSPAQRTWDHNTNESSINSPVDLGSGVTVEPMFSPNTNHLLKHPPKETPNDMERIFELIAGAKQAVLFLAFDPGNNSILDAAGEALAANPDLFVRGALTSPQRAGNFAAALHEGEEAGEGEEGQCGGRGATEVAVVGEHGEPRRKGVRPAIKKGAKPAIEPDYRAIPAGAINKDDAFGAWEAELNKFGFAIIHNKIVVIDPFSDNCTVVTGSHNLGFRASHNNDENLVIIQGHRGLAEAYSCHVLDIYDHYAWRYWLKENPKDFGKPLETDDKWQDRYIFGPNVKSPELRFWLAAAGAGVAGAAARLGDSAAARPANRLTRSSSKKAASKRAASRQNASRHGASPGAPRRKSVAARKKHK